MQTGKLVRVQLENKSSKIALIVSHKKYGLIGRAFCVLHEGGLEWVFPENITLLDKNLKTKQ